MPLAAPQMASAAFHAKLGRLIPTLHIEPKMAVSVSFAIIALSFIILQ